MVKITHFIGIDISKETVDVALISAAQPQQAIFNKVLPNTAKGALELKRSLKHLGLAPDEVLVCMEYTGLYSRSFARHLLSRCFYVWMEMAYQIKHSSGMKREKTDQADALAIAKYCYRFRDKARLYRQQDDEFEKLQSLLTCRDMLVQKKSDINKYLNELQSMGFTQETKLLTRAVQEATKGLDKAILKAEEQIDKFVAGSEQITKQLQLLTSIPSIGRVTALTFIAITRGFTKTETGKALASYSGVAPFKHHSGTSVRGKARVSFMANKRLKSLLHLCALRLIQMKGHFKDYYIRKVAEGKNKMLVINALRNKIVLRMFAVIKNQKIYTLDLLLS